MKQLTRKSISILLALLMALSVFGAASFTAGAYVAPSYDGFSTLPTSDDGLSVGDYWFDLASFLADAAAQGMPSEAAAQYTDGTYFYFLSDDHDTFRLATREDYHDYVRGTDEGDFMFPYISQYSPAGQGYAVGDLIEFGGYPQAQVTDADTIAALDALEKTWVSYGYYSGTGNSSDGNMIPGDWMRYADVPYNGARYRAVTFDSYRPEYTDWVSVASKSNQDENGYESGNIYYFKFEPLQWRVLDPAAGLVLCESVIDCQVYQNVIYKNGSEYYQGIGSLVFANDYAAGSIRSWLNEDLYNTAFSAAEKVLIAETVLDNSAYSTDSSEYDSASTTDKIFLLSWSDARNAAYGFGSDNSRCAQGTDYAKCQGLYVSNSNPNSYWWLRSPGYSSDCASGVDLYGRVYYGHLVHHLRGVRPAFQFKSGITESVNPEGYECIDHKAGAPVESVITPAGCGSAGEKKLTTYCTVCGELVSETTEPISATGEHVWKWVVDDEPTCGAAGKKHQECENCDAVQAENTAIDPTGEHVWKWVVDDEPTCGAAGKKHQECENCDAVQAENTVIEATGEHVWKWVVDEAATCGKAGVKHQKCENCDATQAEGTAIPATGNHVTERQGAIEATETEDGYTGDLVCTVCGKTVKKGTVIPATGTDTPEEPDEPTVGGKIHGEHCFCYDYKGNGLMVNIVRYLCAIFCFFRSMRSVLGA